MICLICGKNSELYYTIGKNPICPDCASLALSVLAEYSIPGLSVVDESEVDVESFLTQSEIVSEEKISDDEYYCEYLEKNIVMSAGADCDVDADEDPVDGVYDSGRQYGAQSCCGCRYLKKLEDVAHDS